MKKKVKYIGTGFYGEDKDLLHKTKVLAVHNKPVKFDVDYVRKMEEVFKNCYRKIEFTSFVLVEFDYNNRTMKIGNPICDDFEVINIDKEDIDEFDRLLKLMVYLN